MDGEIKVYLIHIEMPGANRERLSETLSILKSTLKRLGRSDLIYNSPNVDLVGFILETDRAAGQIVAAFETGDGKSGSATRSGDKFMVLEIGEDFAWTKMGLIDSYLRHRGGRK